MVNAVVVVAVAYVLKTLYKGTKHFPSTGKKQSREITLIAKNSTGMKFTVPNSNFVILGFPSVGSGGRRSGGDLVFVGLFWSGFLWVCLFNSAHELTFFPASQIPLLFSVSDLIADSCY